MSNIHAFMAWEIDSELLKIMKCMMDECKDVKPKEKVSKQVEMNSLLCGLVDIGAVDLLRKSGRSRPYWGPTALFWRMCKETERRTSQKQIRAPKP